jgi:hypothetical protein
MGSPGKEVELTCEHQLNNKGFCGKSEPSEDHVLPGLGTVGAIMSGDVSTSSSVKGPNVNVIEVAEGAEGEALANMGNMQLSR